MAYQPKLSDIEDIPSGKTGGYTPKLSDLDGLDQHVDFGRQVERFMGGALEGAAEPGKDLNQLLVGAINKLLGSKLDPVQSTRVLAQPQDEASLASRIGKFGGEMAIAAPLGGVTGIAREAIPELISKAPALSGALRTGLAASGVGAGYGALTDPAHRGEGALLGAGAGLGGEAAGRALKYIKPSNIKRALQSHILDKLKSGALEGKNLTPAAAKIRLEEQFTNPDGSRIPVDIGTLTKHSGLQKGYNMLKHVPLSGTDLNNPFDVEDYANKYINNNLADIADTSAASLDPKATTAQKLSSSVKNQFETQKKIGNDLYAPFEQAKELQLNKLGPGSELPDYSSSAKDLLDHRESLRDIFGDEKDLGAGLNSELDKAESFISGKSKTPITLGEAQTRVKSIGKLGRALKIRGHYDQSRLMGTLGKGLESDVDRLLRRSGHGDLADSLQEANHHWKHNVVPYYGDRTIKKAIFGGVPTQDKLAKAMFDPNNSEVLDHATEMTKNNALLQSLTKGKGTAEGLSNMSAKDIGNAYRSLPVDTKVKIKEFNPDANKTLEQFSRATRSKVSPSQEEQTKRALAELIKKGATYAKTGVAGAAAFHNPLATAATLGVGVPTVRMLSKTLKDPDLLDAYLHAGHLTAPESSQAAINLSHGLAQALRQSNTGDQR